MDEETKKRVTITIMGEEHTIRGSASPRHLKKVAEYVDHIMHKVAKTNPQMSRHKIAILACINLADELIRLKTRKGKKTQQKENDKDELV